MFSVSVGFGGPGGSRTGSLLSTISEFWGVGFVVILALFFALLTPPTGVQGRVAIRVIWSMMRRHGTMFTPPYFCAEPLPLRAGGGVSG